LTLIVVFLSDEFVALASDRRITWTIGGSSSRWEDTENKAVVLAGQYLLGYTGFARLGGVKTERWITEKLSGADPATYFPVLTSATEAAVNALGLPAERSGHAFIAVGYTAIPEDASGALHPSGVTISNALRWGYGTWRPTRTFEAGRVRPSGRYEFRLNAVGIPPSRDLLEKTIDLIRRYRKAQPSKMLGVLQIMVELIRHVAAHDDGVSEDVSVSVLPRSAVPAQHFAMPTKSGHLPDPFQELTCMFVPANRDAAQAEVYGPASVSPGLSMYGAETWSSKPSWWTDS
jgi:hypothetical protein